MKVAHQSFHGPDLSVVVASHEPLKELDSFLDKLMPQVIDGQTEVIVAGCQVDNSQKAVVINRPGVDFIEFPENTMLPVLFEAGISRSKGEVVAITDSTCELDRGWVRAILDVHQDPAPVIGGAVEVNGISRLVDWAAYFCEYGQFMLPVKKGVAAEVPGNNLSFKRWVLSRGKEFTQDGFWKTYWCRKLQEQGIELELRPSVVVYYTKSFKLMPFLVRRFHHGRCFAGMRVIGAPRYKRLAYAMGSFLLPLIFFMRTIARVMPKKRRFLAFTVSLPIIALAVLTWSAGEFCGYLAGTGKSCAHVV